MGSIRKKDQGQEVKVEHSNGWSEPMRKRNTEEILKGKEMEGQN